jgi:hypothetical protein
MVNRGDINLADLTLFKIQIDLPFLYKYYQMRIHVQLVLTIDNEI